MGMPAPVPIQTIDELLALPEDGRRHELLDGEHVVTPAPRRPHQRAVMEFAAALRVALADREDLEVLSSPADIRLGPRTLVQPDLFIVRRGTADDSWEGAGVPFLVVEVLSPSTAARDRNVKRRLYLEAGVEEYWIVDLDARLVERWRAGDERPEILDATLEWTLRAGASGSVDLAALFGRLGG